MLNARFDATSIPSGGAIHVVFGAEPVAPDGYVTPDPVTTLSVVCEIGSGWTDAQRTDVSIASRVETGSPAAAGAAVAWRAASRIATDGASGWAGAARAASLGRMAWGAALRAAWLWAEREEAATRAVWAWADIERAASRVAGASADSWASAMRVVMLRRDAFRHALRSGISHSAPWQTARRAGMFARDGWQEGRRPPLGRWGVPPLPPIPPGCYTPPHGRGIHARFASRAVATGGPIHVVFRCGDAVKVPLVIPTLRYYIVLNTATLTRVSNNLRIPTFGLQISIAADSAKWTWSASVPLAKLGDLERDDPDTPVELEAEVNGQVWRLVLGSIRESERFDSMSLQIGGYGLSDELGAPVFPAMSHDNMAGAATAQQLAAAALAIAGVDWSLDWQIDDWLVPAGAWVHTATPLAAIARIAEAAGAYVQPAQASRVLRILPRYPVAPWNWSGETPDIIIPASAVIERGTDHVRKAGYNVVFVSGETGINARVWRDGTAANLPAASVVDSLITAASPARGRGLSILGDTGAQQRITLETGIRPDDGLIHVGKLIDWTRGADIRRGLVRSLAVSARGAQGTSPLIVRQTVEVECHG